MTTEIARYMVALEATWDAHLAALFVERDPRGAIAGMTREPSVRHLPTGTGAEGGEAVAAFFAETVVPHLPGGLTRTRVSRTVDRFRLVDESTVAFTHDRELPWLLPGTAATDRRVEALTISVVGFRRGEIESVRTLWDLTTVCDQLAIEAPTALSRAGAGR